MGGILIYSQATISNERRGLLEQEINQLKSENNTLKTQCNSLYTYREAEFWKIAFSHFQSTEKCIGIIESIIGEAKTAGHYDNQVIIPKSELVNLKASIFTMDEYFAKAYEILMSDSLDKSKLLKYSDLKSREDSVRFDIWEKEMVRSQY